MAKRVDCLLLANYGIIEETRSPHRQGLIVVAPLGELSEDERRDLMEFAQFLRDESADAIDPEVERDLLEALQDAEADAAGGEEDEGLRDEF